MSPPRLTSTLAPRLPVHAARAAICGQRLGSRAQIDLDSGWDAHRAACAVEPHALPAGGGDDPHARVRTAASDDDGEVRVPAESAKRSADGRIDDRRRCEPRRRSATAIASRSSGLHANGRPAAAVEQRELGVLRGSGCTSRRCARSSSVTISRAAGSAWAAGTETAAVVPSARKVAVAQFTSRPPGDRDRGAGARRRRAGSRRYGRGVAASRRGGRPSHGPARDVVRRGHLAPVPPDAATWLPASPDVAALVAVGAAPVTGAAAVPARCPAPPAARTPNAAVALAARAPTAAVRWRIRRTFASRFRTSGSMLPMRAFEQPNLNAS